MSCRRLARRALEQGRIDDTEDVIRTRHEVYLEQTAPLVTVYLRRGLRPINGQGEVLAVTDRIVSEVGVSPAWTLVP